MLTGIFIQITQLILILAPINNPLQDEFQPHHHNHNQTGYKDPSSYQHCALPVLVMYCYPLLH